MRRLTILLLPIALFLCLPWHAKGQDTNTPDLTGYITEYNGLHDFKVNGFKVLLDDKTRVGVVTGDSYFYGNPGHPYIGQRTRIFGKTDKKHHTIKAVRVAFQQLESNSVSGFAMIDSVPTPHAAQADQKRVRADGYLLLLTSKTNLKSNLPDPSIHGLRTNVWITYHGARQPDGTILVDKAEATDNVIAHTEDKLLAKTDYDPGAVDPKAKQSLLSKSFRGFDPKQVAPYSDDAMQARIDRIGNSLVPAYQKELPEANLTKIIFRFQLVDQKKWHDAITLPSGVILVPRQIVEELPDDSELATILADNIACALEKQTYRQMPARHTITAANVAGDVVGLVVPGAGIATWIATASTSTAMLHHAEQQSGRVSLSLLSDAGYDIHKAPLAWWTLDTSTPQDPMASAMPMRAANLYETLGLAWPESPSDHTTSPQ